MHLRVFETDLGKGLRFLPSLFGENANEFDFPKSTEYFGKFWFTAVDWKPCNEDTVVGMSLRRVHLNLENYFRLWLWLINFSGLTKLEYDALLH